MERADMTWEDKQMAIVNIAYVYYTLHSIWKCRYGNDTLVDCIVLYL